MFAVLGVIVVVHHVLRVGWMIVTFDRARGRLVIPLSAEYRHP
jgi:hypothetical protein